MLKGGLTTEFENHYAELRRQILLKHINQNVYLSKIFLDYYPNRGDLSPKSNEIFYETKFTNINIPEHNSNHDAPSHSIMDY